MLKKRRLSYALLGLALATSSLGYAQNVIEWKGATGDFFDPANWEGGVVPTGTDIAQINNGGSATIGTGAGDRTLGSFRLGSTENGNVSGHVIMNGGVIRVGGTQGDPKPLIGNSAVLSTFIMNGGAILLDGPDSDPGGARAGVNELDWEVGEKGIGRFEMHGNSIFRASDDLKIAENALGDGTALIDGNARVSLGSGLSISGNGGKQQSMVIGGNALVEAGNSMGAGHPDGSSDEGYLTMAFGRSNSKLTVQDNAVLNIRRLTAREGTSHITIKDRAQFHIFDVKNGKGFIDAQTPADRPVENGPNSTYASLAPSDATLILQDDAVMTVNSAQGLGISAPRDAGNAGGTARFIIKDRASFRVEQDLKIGTGAAVSSIGTLEISGPSAKLFVGGNLNLAADPDGNPTPGEGSLSVVLTGSSVAQVEVAGAARLSNGTLKISTSGFTPALDQSFAILKAGSFEGSFKTVDISDAQLPAGLGWTIVIDGQILSIKAVKGYGRPDDNGLTPKSDTIYVNPPDLVNVDAPPLNNNRTESLGIAIASNGNVLVGWEDDGDPITDYEAVWTLYDSNGAPLTAARDITSVYPDFSSQTINSRYLSYFRADGSPTPGWTSWGPKIKSNPFGPGLGMGATSFGLGGEVPAMLEINLQTDGSEGDFPSVQLLNNDGTPNGIVSWSDADTDPLGDIRIGDWEYLSNGNILIVGEDRQTIETTRLGAQTDRNPVFKIVTPAGVEVKGLTLADQNGARAEIWHGSAVVQNGFAIRFGGQVRFFNNAGAPVTDNIMVGDAAGIASAGGPGRGEQIGFHGNGADAYVLAVPGTDADGNRAVIVTVFNADGTVRWSKSGTAGYELNGVDRADAAMSPDGRVAFVFDELKIVEGGNVKTVLGRLLDKNGAPLGGTFAVSEAEYLAGTVKESKRPRVAWRGNDLAVTWESRNAVVSETPFNVVALRTFSVASGASPIQLSVSASGENFTITWTGGNGPFLVQSKTSITNAWNDLATTTERTFTIPMSGTAQFFRIVDETTKTIRLFKATLNGANEKPNAIDTPGAGVALVSVEGLTARYWVTYSNLRQAASAAHIHGPATVNQTASPFGPLTESGALGTSGAFVGSQSLTQIQADAIAGGMAYVNVHSGFAGGGEVRGQLMP